MKLRQILEQLTLELNIPEPKDAYKFDKIASKDLGYGTYYKYAYTNINGDPMEVTIVSTKQPRDPGNTFYVAFGPDQTAQGTKSDFIPDPGDEDPDYEEKYSIKTGAQDTLKVLATVVQAVKNTATKIGGMDKVYQMAWQPSDKKRKNVYDYYVQTLFPDFKKNSTEESQFQSYINKNFKPKNKISEIGNASKAPYGPIDTITDTEQDREYRFSTSTDESGIRYQVDVVTFYRGPMDPVIARVNFGTITDDGDINYDTQTEENDIYRIMATIVSIVKKDIRSNHADIIEFSPTKRTVKQNSKRARAGIKVDTDPMDNVRTKLYLRYIKGQFKDGEFKDAQVTQTLDGDIQVDLRK
jgi:hypothetical protein